MATKATAEVIGKCGATGGEAAGDSAARAPRSTATTGRRDRGDSSFFGRTLRDTAVGLVRIAGSSTTWRMRLSFARSLTPAILFALALPLSACDEDAPAATSPTCGDAATTPDAAATDAADAADAQAPTTPPSLLRFTLEIAADPKLPAIEPLTFDAADGLDEALLVAADGASPALRSVTPLSLWAGSTASAEALSAWAAKIAAFDPCASGDPSCDAAAGWTRAMSDLVRSATLTVKTSDGVWLARYDLAECWPSSFVAAKGVAGQPTPVGELRLSALPRSFALNPSHPFLAGALKEYGLVAKALPDATLGEAATTALSTSLLRTPYAGLEELDVGLDRLDVGRAALGAKTRAPAPTRPTGDYLPAHNFSLEIEGVTMGRFVGVVGGAIDPVEYRNGDDPITHRRPGKAKFKNIVMRVGEESSPALRAWYEKVLAGKTERKSGSVVYLDREGNEVLRVNLSGAYPVRAREAGSGMATGRRQHSTLSTEPGGHVIEEIEFVVEKIERG